MLDVGRMPVLVPPKVERVAPLGGPNWTEAAAQANTINENFAQITEAIHRIQGQIKDCHGLASGSSVAAPKMNSKEWYQRCVP